MNVTKLTFFVTEQQRRDQSIIYPPEVAARNCILVGFSMRRFSVFLFDPRLKPEQAGLSLRLVEPTPGTRAARMLESPGPDHIMELGALLSTILRHSGTE